MITAAIAQRNRDVILWQEWRGGGRKESVETGFHSAGWNERHLDVSSSNEGQVENNCPRRIWEIHREMNNGTKYAYFDSFSSFFFPSVQKKKEKEKQKRSKERFQKGDYCNQQTFIAFHGKLEISDEWN